MAGVNFAFDIGRGKRERAKEWDDLVTKNPDLAPTTKDYNEGKRLYMQTGDLPTERATGKETRREVGTTEEVPQVQGAPIRVLPTTVVEPEMRPIQLRAAGEEDKGLSIRGVQVQDPVSGEEVTIPAKFTSGGKFLGFVSKEEMGRDDKIATPEQNAAILSGDPEKMAKAFPGGVPSWAVTAAGTSANRQRAGKLKSLDAILAQKVQDGEMTLEEALEAKAQQKPQTDTQANAAMFGERAEEAHLQLRDLVQEGFDPTALNVGVERKLPNVAQSDQVQRLEQIKRNFMSAVLRKESGALISPQEMADGDKQYFPQAGDSIGVLKQKKINRETVIRGLRNASGRPAKPKTGKGSPTGTTTKTINGKTYVKKADGWYEQ